MTKLNQELIKSIVRRQLIPGIYVQIPMQEFGGEGGVYLPEARMA